MLVNAFIPGCFFVFLHFLSEDPSYLGHVLHVLQLKCLEPNLFSFLKLPSCLLGVAIFPKYTEHYLLNYSYRQSQLTLSAPRHLW